MAEKRIISISLDRKLVRDLDSRRGGTPRSSFIESILQDYLEETEKTAFYMNGEPPSKRPEMVPRKRLYEALKRKGPVEGYSGLKELYEKSIGKVAPSETTIRRKYVRPLEKEGLIEIDEGKGRIPHRFSASKNP